MIPTKISPLITPNILFIHTPTLLGFFPGRVTFEFFLLPGLEVLGRELVGRRSFFIPEFFFGDTLFLLGLALFFLTLFAGLPAGFNFAEEGTAETLLVLPRPETLLAADTFFLGLLS
ncbi:hypothetical protein [uncultured Varibaculum sp.]|uniref:hypothetical protein n=1 Tax=uncultured Varibaculum sp. TaxID=413896 RepID=UPI0025987141|nr:hypothetical protein [uncultured Varibaculum sp.]